ncbi:type III secretion system stalk subunit SctO [Polycladidibacter hongkongensis]|uniref:type III secretion system stalk subunit SctO n=1 Tax=Polycladidibacter hongkongensis TaxID=1647556 RepID=UPI0008335101|nr:YscO family type III secretion system apparatus protein [Pseudovibrio hongkongensis]
MIAQIKKLHLVKTLKEQKALRALNDERAKLELAEKALREKQQIAQKERVQLPERQDALFREVLRQIISSEKLEEVKEKARLLEAEVKRLEDAAERAAYVVDKTRKNVEEARVEYQKALRVRDKYGKISEDLIAQSLLAAEASEEQEVEEQFSGRRQDTL